MTTFAQAGDGRRRGPANNYFWGCTLYSIMTTFAQAGDVRRRGPANNYFWGCIMTTFVQAGGGRRRGPEAEYLVPNEWDLTCYKEFKSYLTRS